MIIISFIVYYISCYVSMIIDYYLFRFDFLYYAHAFVILSDYRISLKYFSRLIMHNR